MTVPPFTFQQARAIAEAYHGLVGKEYICKHTKQVYKVRSVGVLPFFEYDKLYLSHMYMCMMRKIEGYTVDTIIEFLMENAIKVYDVVLTSIPTENNCEIMAMKSIDTIVTNAGLEYSFNIDLI